jgi:tetratricopeptide (TPR) repeat protein
MISRRLAFLIAISTSLSAFAESADLTTAKSALRDGLYSIAAKRAEKAMSNSDEMSKARLIMLEALAKDKRFSEMLKKLESWGEESNEKFRYWKAIAYLGIENYTRAIETLENEFHNPAVIPMAYRLKARAYTATGDYFAADANYEKAISGIVSNAALQAEVSYERAKMLKSANKIEDALKTVEASGLLRIKGATGDAGRLLAAELAELSGDAKRASEIRKTILSEPNVSEEIFVNTATAESKTLWSTGATNESIKIASQAVNRAKSKRLKMLAGFNLGIKELSLPSLAKKGIERVRSAIRSNLSEPEALEGQIVLADKLLKLRQFSEANAEYRYALESFPRLAIDEHTIEGCAWALMGMGENTQAVAMFARAAQVATNSTTRMRCLFKVGDALVADGKFENAVAAYSRVNEAPYYDEARFSLADALARAGKNEEALKRFTELALDEKASNKVRTSAALRMAEADSAAGRYESAIDVFTKIITNDAIKNQPQSHVYLQALEGRGRAYYRSYRYREASADFEALAKLRPDIEKEMRFFVALCKYGEGENVNARALASKLLEEKPTAELRSEVIMWIAKFDFLQGDYETARKGFETYANEYRKFPRAAEALVFAARSAAARNDFTDAVELVAKCAKEFPSSSFLPEALVLQGEALMELARFDEAVLVLERAERSAVSQVARNRALMLKADCIFAMGADNAARYTEAIAAYRSLSRTEGIPPSMKIAASFKIGRALEKLQRFEESTEQYYTEVVCAYLEAAKNGEWFDEDARAFFARAAFSLVDYHEAGGHLKEAVAILKLVEKSGVSAADEARRRLKKLQEKMKGR